MLLADIHSSFPIVCTSSKIQAQTQVGYCQVTGEPRACGEHNPLSIHYSCGGASAHRHLESSPTHFSAFSSASLWRPLQNPPV